MRFAVIGTGRISRWVLQGAQEDGRFRLVAVCSRDRDRAEAFIRDYPQWADARAYTSVEALATAEDVDAVYIGTPNSTHFTYAKMLLEGGKHVLCEKPLVTSAAQARELADTARRCKRLLMEAMISTLNPHFTLAATRVPDLAPVHSYVSSFCQYSSKYEDLGKGIVASSLDPLMGGGALMDIGIYTIYPMIVLFGAPDAVSSEAILADTPHGPVDIGGSIRCTYPGMTANLVFSKAVDSFLPTEIAGEKGTLLLDAVHICRELRLVPHGTPTSGRGPSAQAQILSSGIPHDVYYYEFKHFMDLVEDGCLESPVNRLDTSVAVQDVMDAFKRAVRLIGVPVLQD